MRCSGFSLKIAWYNSPASQALPTISPSLCSQEHHHRAVDDARVTAEIFVKFIEMLRDRKIKRSVVRHKYRVFYKCKELGQYGLYIRPGRSPLQTTGSYSHSRTPIILSRGLAKTTLLKSSTGWKGNGLYIRRIHHHAVRNARKLGNPKRNRYFRIYERTVCICNGAIFEPAWRPQCGRSAEAADLPCDHIG